MNFSAIQLTMKFPTAIAINKKPNQIVMYVNCKIDASQDGGNRIAIVVKIAATVIVTMNGTIVSNEPKT